MAYSVTKAAHLHLMKCLAQTQGPKLRINAVLPGVLLTEWVCNSPSVCLNIQNTYISNPTSVPILTVSRQEQGQQLGDHFITTARRTAVLEKEVSGHGTQDSGTRLICSFCIKRQILRTVQMLSYMLRRTPL